MGKAKLEFRCEDCPHVFSQEDIILERSDKAWGHPCHMHPRSQKAYRCEAYRACFRVERIKSPISDDNFQETP